MMRSLRLLLGVAITAIGGVYLWFAAGLINILLSFAFDWQSGIGAAVYVVVGQVMAALLVAAAWLLCAPEGRVRAWSAARRRWVATIVGAPGMVVFGYIFVAGVLPKLLSPTGKAGASSGDVIGMIQIVLMITAGGWLTAGLWVLRPFLPGRRRVI